MIRSFLILLFLAIYFIISLPLMLIGLIIQQFNMNLRNNLAYSWLKVGLKIVTIVSGIKLTLNGLDNIPQDRAVLFTGNHTSLFDIVVTYPYLKRPTGYISKKEIKKVPILSWIMYFLNCIFLDREDPRSGLNMVLKSAESITNGVSMFLFPEGTRSKTGELLDFKEASFKIVSKSKCTVVPVAITGTADIFENHFPKIKSAKVTVTFGEPIDTADWSRAEFKELPSITRDRIATLLDNQ